MRYLDSETVRILYRAKRNITGLSDVKIDIWDNSGTKVVNADTLTELSNGLYYYDYTLSSIGNFLYNITCSSQPHYVEGTFQSVGRNSLWVKKSGGGGGLIVNEFKKEEVDKLYRILRETKELILSMQKIASKSFSKNEDEKITLNDRLKKLNKSVELISSIVVATAPTDILLKFENGNEEN